MSRGVFKQLIMTSVYNRLASACRNVTVHNLFLSVARIHTTHAQHTLHKVFEKTISNLEFSTVKVSVIVLFLTFFLTKGHIYMNGNKRVVTRS